MGVHGHWNTVYETNAPDRASWYEGDPQVSLELTASAGLATNGRIADVGAGVSHFPERLRTVHRTPDGREQPFNYVLLIRDGDRNIEGDELS